MITRYSDTSLNISLLVLLCVDSRKEYEKIPISDSYTPASRGKLTDLNIRGVY